MRGNPLIDTRAKARRWELNMVQGKFTGTDYGIVNMPTEEEKRTPVDEHRAFMRKNFSFFGGISVLYALFLTFCLYRNTSGITFPFFVAGTLVCFFLCMKRSGVPWKGGSSFYLVSILLLGISVFLTDNGAILFMTQAGIGLLFLCLALHQYLDDEKWDFPKFLCIIGQCLLETIASMGYPASDGNAWFLEREKGGKAGKGRYVLLGILCLIPLLTVILTLLLSADRVFRHLAGQFVRYMDLWKAGEILCLTAAAFWCFYSFIAMLNRRVLREECGERKKQEPILAVTITGVLAVVYVIFCGIQVGCLFLGQVKGSLPDGYTYASYAREGFFQLLWVCIINLAIVLTCLSLFRESRVLRGLLALISMCTCILAASSAYRMILYISVYKLTFLRILVLWALGVIGLMLAGIFLRIFRPGFPLLRYLTAVVTVCYLFLAFAKPDYWIASYNCSRPTELEENGGDRRYSEDYRYLAGLSADAAPVLLSGELEADFSEELEDYRNRMEDKAESCGIRTFNLSRYLAGKALEKRDWNG